MKPEIIATYTIKHSDYRCKVKEKKTRKIFYCYWGYSYTRPIVKTSDEKFYKFFRDSEFIIIQSSRKK